MERFTKLQDLIATADGLDPITKHVEFLEANNGNCRARLQLVERHLDYKGNLDVGFVSSLSDVVSSLGMQTHKFGQINATTVDLNVLLLKDVNSGDELFIDSTLLKADKLLAFVEVKIVDSASKDLVAMAKLTKRLNKKPLK